MLYRATVCIDADKPDQEDVFAAWLDQWKDSMTFVSGNYGCGCCVLLFDVEGPKDAIDALPEAVRMGPSEWTENGTKSGDPSLDIVPQK